MKEIATEKLGHCDDKELKLIKVTTHQRYCDDKDRWWLLAN